jgi:hypothetical protein
MLSTLSKFTQEQAPDGRWRDTYQAGKKRVIARYSNHKKKALIYYCNEDIAEQLKGFNTSSGFYFIESGYRHKDDVPVEQLFETYASRMNNALETGSFNEYMIWFHRSQASGEFNPDGSFTNSFSRKSRPVWAVSMWTVLSEWQFARPLNRWLKYYPYSAIGKPDEGILRWINTERMRRAFWVSLDYSKYDSSIPSWLIEDAFEVLASAFNLSDQQQALLNVLKEDFINKNLITADGVVPVSHGNPSGSGLTAIINGICNELMTETWMGKFGYQGEYCIMGDDNLIFTTKAVDVKEVSTYVKHCFGVEIHADDDKASVQGRSFDDPQFLSRTWKRGGAWRLPEEIFSKMLFPERFRDYEKIEGFTPELVFYSYYLAYPMAMSEVFDMRRFLNDNHFTSRTTIENREMLRVLPYNVRTWHEVA